MKTYHVYELVNNNDVVEYVGRTTKPVQRLYQHTKRKPSNGNTHGKYYGRTDLIIRIAKTFTNVKEANKYEGELKKLHGFEWTEQLTGKINGKINGKSPKYTKRKLEYEKAQWVRAQYARKFDMFGKKITQRRLARVFGVNSAIINQIVNNISYIQP